MKFDEGRQETFPSSRTARSRYPGRYAHQTAYLSARLIYDRSLGGAIHGGCNFHFNP